MQEFQNPELNKLFAIPGKNYEIEIQDPQHRYKGKLSGIPRKETVEYLISRGHPIVTRKATAPAAPAQATPQKPAAGSAS